MSISRPLLFASIALAIAGALLLVERVRGPSAQEPTPAAVQAADASAAPADAAQESGPTRGLKVNEPGVAPGYVMFAPLRSRTAYVIDSEANVLHTWTNDLSPLSIYLLNDGSLLRCGRVVDNPTFNRGGRSGKIHRLDKDSNIIWEFDLCTPEQSLHHDIEPLPNGNILAIAWERVSFDEAVALGRKPAHVRASGWWPGKVIEIEPTGARGGKIVWEWRSREHLIQDFDPSKPNYGSIREHPERIDVNADLGEEPAMTEEERLAHEEELQQLRDLGYMGTEEEDEDPAPQGEQPKRGRQHRTDDWLHLNGIDYHPEADLIVLSTPEMNEVWIIDHSTTTEQARTSLGGRWGKGGDLLYRWGNPASYGQGDAGDRQLFFQHQPEWVPPGMPGAGNLTIYNNGLGRPGQKFSAIDELELPFDMETGFTRAPDAAFGPATPVWSYSDPGRFYSFFISGAHRLPNGNTFICSGKQGRLFEVNQEMEVVWEFWNPYGGELERVFNNGGKDLTKPTSCFRATKLAPDHPGLRALGILKQQSSE